MNRPHPLRDAGLALSLLTVVPTPASLPDDGNSPQVAGWFPLVGLVLGAVGYGFVKFVEAVPSLHHQPLLIAALVVTMWALATRMLHFDGLADVADAYWGSHDAARRLEIMKDTHVGAFGVTAVTLCALVEVAALAAVLSAPHESPVLLVPVIARFSATAGAWLGTPARAGGLGRSVMGRPTILGALPTVAVLVAVGAAFYLWFAWLGVGLLTFGVLLALGIPHLLARRFGGVTGDVLGASVLLTETLLFVSFALVA